MVFFHVYFSLEHDFDFYIYWDCHHPNWRTHIFQRGWNHHQKLMTWGVVQRVKVNCRYCRRSKTKNMLLPFPDAFQTCLVWWLPAATMKMFGFLRIEIFTTLERGWDLQSWRGGASVDSSKLHGWKPWTRLALISSDYVPQGPNLRSNLLFLSSV